MKIYNYRHDTKEYINTEEAHKDPIDGEFMIPANATDIKPLETKQGFAVCFLSGKWEYVENHIGTKIYKDNETKEVEELGAISQGWSLTQSKEVIFENTKKEKIQQLKQRDNSTEVNSFKLNGVETWLNKDARTGFKNSCEALKTMGKDKVRFVLPELGIDNEISIQLALVLLTQLEVYSSTCAVVTKQHLMAIEKLTTIEELEGYDYTTGYPDKLEFKIE